MGNLPSEPAKAITTTATITFRDVRIKAVELADFFAGVPGHALVSIKEERGDQGDPREAGLRTTTITATWNGVVR
jgi:hypothetical protein